MENLEKRITVGQEKFDKLCTNLCGKKKSYFKEIIMLEKNLTKQNVQFMWKEIILKEITMLKKKSD